jgi:ubiquinone/menaquinone biosynthesis C-methylase UbiE
MTLARVLEPEVMDTPEDAHDYDTMDHTAVNRVFAADFLATFGGSGVVLDVGTGTAQIPIEVCRRNPDLTIVAIDLADHMLALARRNIDRAGLTERIRAEKADGKAFAYPPGAFRAVMSNSIIHHIPDPSLCFAEMHRVCAVGGVLFVRDLVRPPDEQTLARLVETYTAGCNDHQRRLFSDSLRAALTLDEVHNLVGRLGYAADTVTMTSDRHWTWAAIRAE